MFFKDFHSFQLFFNDYHRFFMVFSDFHLFFIEIFDFGPRGALGAPSGAPAGDDAGDDDGRIFLEDPTPINPRRDNISRKGNPSLRYIEYIHI